VKDDDFELDRLLSGGHLGRPAYDDVLRRVLERTGTVQGRAARRGGRILAAGGLLAVVGAWLVIARSGRSPEVAPRPKGAAAVAPAAVDVGCAGPAPSVCRAGDTLMFKVDAGAPAGYLGAFAVPEDGPGSERIWYFPTAAGHSPLVRTASDTVVLPDGVLIGPEHRPGRYRITLWISSRPLGRAEADAPEDGAIQSRAVVHVQVVP
jgi:hypothetical protein